MRQKKTKEPKTSLTKVLAKVQDPLSGFNKLIKYLKKRACSRCWLSQEEIQEINQIFQEWVSGQTVVAKIKLEGIRQRPVINLEVCDQGQYLKINKMELAIQDVLVITRDNQDKNIKEQEEKMLALT